MLFRDIVGYEEEKAHLIQTVRQNKIAHARLFSGKPGSANLALALAFSTYLNCTNRGEHDACGVCDACSKSLKYIHPDVHFAFPTSSTKKVKGPKITSAEFMKEWREFLKNDPYPVIEDWNKAYGGEEKSPIIPVEESRKIIRDLSLKSFEGNYKILIMWLPELMNTSAANALLKILEEPPEKTLFILVSNQHERLISTILSRTQLFNVRRFRDQEVLSILSEELGPDQNNLDEVVHLAEGNLNYARKLAMQNETSAQDFFMSWMRNCYGNDYGALLQQTDEFQKKTKMAQRSLIMFSISVLREALVAQLEGAEILNRASHSLSGFINDFKSVMKWDKIERITSLLNTAGYHLERNANAKILFLDLSLQISREIKK